MLFSDKYGGSERTHEVLAFVEKWFPRALGDVGTRFVCLAWMGLITGRAPIGSGVVKIEGVVLGEDDEELSIGDAQIRAHNKGGGSVKFGPRVSKQKCNATLWVSLLLTSHILILLKVHKVFWMLITQGNTD